MNSKMVLGSLLVFCLAETPASKADFFEITMTVRGTVNGKPVLAEGIGWGDSATGFTPFVWGVGALPQRDSVYASIFTQANLLLAAVSREERGALNLLTLADGNFLVAMESSYPGGGNITSNLAVTTQGTMILGTSELSGNVDLPHLVGVHNGTATWNPGPRDNQFVEEFTQLLERRDGGAPIRVTNTATYTLPAGRSLPNRQRRNVFLRVMETKPNRWRPTAVRLQYESVVVPEPGTSVLLVAGILTMLRRRH